MIQYYLFGIRHADLTHQRANIDELIEVLSGSGEKVSRKSPTEVKVIETNHVNPGRC